MTDSPHRTPRAITNEILIMENNIKWWAARQIRSTSSIDSQICVDHRVKLRIALARLSLELTIAQARERTNDQ